MHIYDLEPLSTHPLFAQDYGIQIHFTLELEVWGVYRHIVIVLPRGMHEDAT